MPETHTDDTNRKRDDEPASLVHATSQGPTPADRQRLRSYFTGWANVLGDLCQLYGPEFAQRTPAHTEILRNALEAWGWKWAGAGYPPVELTPAGAEMEAQGQAELRALAAAKHAATQRAGDAEAVR